MADGPSSPKIQKTDSAAPLPECPYGTKCYRKNPQHFKEFAHSSSGSSAADTTKPVASDNHARPPCKYGSSCYRKNLLHFAEFSHPMGHAPKGKDESGSDTEVYDSGDDEPSTDGEKKLVKDGGLTLVKRYSEMTDKERKELIAQAVQEKQKLQKQLELAKKKMEEKEKELEHLHEQLNGGLLLMEGEAEALKKNTTTYFPLLAERKYKEGSASQMHFRLAESQFYRLVTGGRLWTVTKVEYVVSPSLVERFRSYQKDLKKRRGEKYADAILAFHGTEVKNIVPICEKGFRTPGDSKFQHRTDTGYYGAGVYFSEYPSYSMGYVQGANKLMLCLVLPGKVYTCDSLIMGAQLQKGYDSHMSPCKNEVIIFDSAAILPSYIIHYEQDLSPSVQLDPVKVYYEHEETVETTTVLDQYQDAIKAAPTKVFSGKRIALSGKLITSQAEIYKLIATHGGKKGTTYEFDILVASKAKVVDGFSREVLQAMEDDLPIVPELYLYQCINQKKKLKPHDYEFDVLPDH